MNKSVLDIKEITDKVYYSSIQDLVEELIENNSIFDGLDKNKIVQLISRLIMELHDEQLAEITKNDLKNRIEKIMLVETMAGMLNDLSPAQVKSFDEAIDRREFV
jgi:uncharacterized membrane-anchored protein YjiN (DUF445 family)